MPERLRIAIDALGVNEVGGARSVTIPLLKRVFLLKENWQFYCYLSAFEEELDLPNVKQIILPLSKGLMSRFLIQLMIPILTLMYKIDITHFIKSQASLLFNSKKILTIYDCTILKFPEYFNLPSRLFWRYVQPSMSKHMDQIITISNDAKSEITAYLGVVPEKISVIYPASQFEPQADRSPTSLGDLNQKSSIGDEYILYVGQIGFKKNLMTLIHAYQAIKEVRHEFPPLILVGPRYYLSDAGNILDSLGPLGLEDDVQYLGPLSKNDLYHVLKNASLLVFPSIHEGFGMPMLEAMQMGVPVIASNTSVMPEVLQDAGVLVDDFLSPSAWAEEIMKLFDSLEARELLANKGIERAKFFSWDQSAKQLIVIYEALA